ncbi:MAG: AraC family transcriptional regulator [Panacibacter sp.]
MNNTYNYFVSHPDEFKQLVVKDVLFLHYICPQAEKYMYLNSHLNQIGFTLAGDKTIHVGEKAWIMTQESSIFVKKTAWKQELGTTGWEILSFYFPDNYLKFFFKEYREQLPLKNLPAIPSDMLIKIEVDAVTRAFFYGIIPYFNQRDPPPEDLLELKFKELLFHILSNPNNAEVLAYINSMMGNSKPPLDEIMEANFNFNLTLEEYARIAQRSLATFKRDFEELYHSSPGKWLKTRRLKYAKHLLDTSKMNINEIACDSGFENATHFIRVFKEEFGMAPLQLRKQLKVMMP